MKLFTYILIQIFCFANIAIYLWYDDSLFLFLALSNGKPDQAGIWSHGRTTGPDKHPAGGVQREETLLELLLNITWCLYHDVIKRYSNGRNIKTLYIRGKV